MTLGALPKIWIVYQKYGSHAFKASSSSNLVIRTLKGFCQKYGSIILIGKVHAFKARSSHPDIRIDPYFWKTVVGQLFRPFWGGGVKNTPFSGFWLPHIYH